jgi:4-amino-4-deoxy-L-arabinose transferase-like glycosyltransferase
VPATQSTNVPSPLSGPPGANRPSSTDDGVIDRYLGTPTRLFAALFVWLFALAWARPLANPDEGRYLDIPRWMVESGDWLVPRINGLPFLHKPPLFFWLEAVFIKLFGVSPWVGRITPVLAALVLIGSVYALIRALDGQRAATWSALVLATTPLLYGGAQYINLDMLVAATITLTTALAILAMLGESNAQRRQYLLYAAYAAAGLSFLAKGLIGFLLPGAIFVAYAIACRRFDWLVKALSPIGLVIFAVIALPWLYFVEQRVPGAVHHFIVFHHFERFTIGGFNNQWGPWFYPTVLAGASLPWTVPFVQTLIERFAPSSAPKNWNKTINRSSITLGLIWLAIIIVFFSIPKSKLVGYILPALPGIALILAPAIAARADRWRGLAIAAAVCVLVVSIIAAVQSRGPIDIARALQREIKPADTLVFTERYHFDVSVHLNRTAPAYVVDDWTKQSRDMPDNVRRQLTEGREFDRIAAHVLIGPDELPALIGGPKRVFILTTTKRQSELPALQVLKVAVPPDTRGFLVLSNR